MQNNVKLKIEKREVKITTCKWELKLYEKHKIKI